MWTHFSRWIHGRANGLLKRRRMSRLTARIMAIMLFPLAIFLVGLLSLDQYRTTLIQSEFVALERQGSRWHARLPLLKRPAITV